MLFLQAVFAFLVLPTMVGFVIPLWLIAPRHDWSTFDRAGYFFLVPGLVILLWTVVEFYVTGKGTLAPWSPPKRLVTSGLYRYSRNPMYVGVLLILAGWAMGFHSSPLWIYAAFMAVAFHLRVIVYEEPTLRRLHGDDVFDAYRRKVRRWF